MGQKLPEINSEDFCLGNCTAELNKDPDLEIPGKRVRLRPGLSVAESKGGGVGDCSFLLALRPGAVCASGAPCS